MRFAPDPLARIGSAPTADRFTVAEIIADCTSAGILDELRSALDIAPKTTGTEATRVVRDLVYELAGTNNRDLAVDVLIHATGLGEFDCRTLRDYARRHGMTAEGFRKHVNAMRRRLGLANETTRDEN
ncbi:MAG: hypothetical protein KBC32_07850 [Candidatus Didemnitutus sp.]|nr:hypothetical protein [Candidatus Didemnitutus sp.]